MKTFLVIALLLICLNATHAQEDIPALMRHVSTQHLINATIIAVETADSADDGYAALEAEMFARMNWGDEEIAWFRATYGPDSMFGTQEAYIYDVAALYEQLDAANAP